jgi:PAS domain S-box-containing protein
VAQVSTLTQTAVETPALALEVNYHALLSNSPDAVLLFDLDDMRLLDANAKAVELFGRPLAELLGQELASLCPPAQRDGQPSRDHLDALVAQVRAGVIAVFDTTFAHAGARLIDCEMRLVVMPTPERRLMHARIIDVTERRRGDLLRAGQSRVLEMIARGADLTETLDALMLLIESQSDGVYCSVLLLDDDGVRIHPGSAPSLPKEYMDALDNFPIGPDVGSCGTAMWRKETVVVSDVLSDPLWAPYKGLIEPHGFRACWSTPIYLERSHVLGSFAMYYREVRSPVADDMRLISVATHLAGIAIERTRRERELRLHRNHLEELVEARTAELTQAKERTDLVNEDLATALKNLSMAQEELVRRDKLAALGALVAGVAHELNTPIGNSLVMATTMADHTRELSASMGDGLRRSTLDAYLVEANQAGEILVRNLQKAADLVSSFKLIAVDQAGSQRRRFSLSGLLAEVLASLAVPIKERPIRVALDAAADLEMDSYPGALTQVVMSLFDNCLVHAFEGEAAGNIVVSAQRQGELLALTVADDGAGIAQANLAHVYDPFFTTKLGSGGSGLGLHIAHNIVTGILGGRIELSSDVGVGTRFVLLLPPVAPAFGPRG